MSDIVERLRFDAVRCEMQFSKGVAGNIEEAAAEIERLRAALQQIRDEFPDSAGFTDARQIAADALRPDEQKAREVK